MNLANLSEEAYEELLQKLRETVDPPPAPVLSGTKGFCFIYGPGVFSATILGECRYRQKGRRYKGVKIFALGDEEAVVHYTFNLYREMLEDIGALQYLDIIEKFIQENG